MDIEGFRNRLKQYKKAREENPGLKYWEWKDIPKYDEGTDSVDDDLNTSGIKAVFTTDGADWRKRPTQEQLDAFYSGNVKRQIQLAEQAGQTVTYTNPKYTLDEVVVSAKDLKKERQHKQEYNNVLDLGITAAGFIPGLGEVADVVDVVNQLRQGNYGDAGLSALAAIIPGVPASIIRRGGNDITRRYLKYVGQNPDKSFAGMKINQDKLTPLQKQQLQILLDNDVDPHYITSKNLDKALQIREKTLFDTAPSNWIYHKPKWDEDLEIMEDQLFDLNNAKSVTPERALYDVSYESPKDVAINNAYMTLTDTGEHMDIGMVRKTNQYAKGTYEHLLNAATNVAKFRKRKGVLSGRDLMSPDITKHLWTKYNDKELFSKNGGYHLYGVYQPGDIMNIKSPTYRVPETKSILFNPNVLSDDGKMIIDWNSEDISFAEGGEVTGPPTEEQWYADINKYNPTILDNASLEWSMNALKKELHSQAMGLPGYAPMWNEYMRSLPKAAPDVDEFVDDVWANENPNNVGYKKGKYYPHKSPEGGKMTIGPGLKLGSGSHRISEREAKRGVTKPRLNQEMRRVAKGYFKDVDTAINNGQTTNPADTVSPQIKAGLADILHQTGSLKKWPKLINSVREGDLEKIKEESIVTWRDDNGVLHEDTRRNNLRNKKYWHY